MRDYGASKAILAAYFAAAILVVLIRLRSYIWLGNEGFAHSPQKAQADEDEAPEAEPASRSRRFARRLRRMLRPRGCGLL